MASFRNELSSSQRSLDLELKIDPGFVHQRKIQTIGGQGVMDIRLLAKVLTFADEQV